jgi:hypothetical protein
MEQLIDDLREKSEETYKDFLLNITDYKSNFNSSIKSQNRRLCKSRKARITNKK